MKKILISALVLSFGLTFAQKKEIQSASKAVEAGNIAAAQADLAKAEGILGGKLYLLEPALLEQYYYAKGVSLLKSGKTTEGAILLGKIADLGRETVYTGKNSQKEKVFFVGKAEADKYGAGVSLKESKYTPETTAKLAGVINPLLQSANDVALKEYNAKNYGVAADRFVEVYNLLKAGGNDDKTFKYYAALNYALAKKYPEAIRTYQELIDEGYTGVKTEYKAKTKDGKDVSFGSSAEFELMKKNPDYNSFTTSTTPSIEQELYETSAGLYIDMEQYDKALSLLERGVQKFPASTRLGELQGITYYKAGKTDQFIESLKAQVVKNPKEKVSWYNLGVLAAKDPARTKEAEGYFLKALEVDPNYIPALQGIFYNIYMGDDEKTIATIEAARKAKKTDVFNKLLEERRNRFAKGLPYVEKWYALEPNNLEVVSLLKGLYQTTRNEAKYAEMKAKETALSKK